MKETRKGFYTRAEIAQLCERGYAQTLRWTANQRAGETDKICLPESTERLSSTDYWKIEDIQPWIDNFNLTKQK